MQNDTAVILLAYGSPGSLSDIPTYLRNVRAGRRPPQDLVDRIINRYKAIGGRSPLLPLTKRIAQKLAEGLEMPVYIGMLHWHPYLEDTVEQMRDEGVGTVIAIPLAPHYSDLSIGKYHQRMVDALASGERKLDLRFVKSWHDQEHYLEGCVAHIQAGLKRFPARERDQVKVIFTAHSLPISRLEEDDVYEDQLIETARALAERLALDRKRWTLAYQSAPRADSTWMGPHLETLVKNAAEAGNRHLLIAPIGFITDHLEILYDIDVKLKTLAESQHLNLKRIDMLNDSPALVETLTSLVKRNLDIYD
ncbi:MAG: ferrochelatase [Anaerolineales bacterium]